MYFCTVNTETPGMRQSSSHFGALKMLLLLAVHFAAVEHTAASEYTTLGDACSSCPAGTYMDQVGQTQCKPCIRGSFLDGLGSDEASDCQKCGIGTYSDTLAATKANTCEACPAGVCNTHSLRILSTFYAPGGPLPPHPGGGPWGL